MWPPAQTLTASRRENSTDRNITKEATEELKAGEFQPEHAGKLNFYLSAVDDLVRDGTVDGPTIGLLLCRAKNRLVAEYALRDIEKPIGVADIQLTRLLPARLEGQLPSVEELEAELAEPMPPDVMVKDELGDI